MGIPGLFGSFIAKKLKKSVRYNLPIFVSSLALDMNGIFHEARAIVMGDDVQDDDIKKAIKRKNPYMIETEIILVILEIIIELVKDVQPHDCLLMCVDGPAPQAKLIQQKSRRQTADQNAQFDSNAITPGTEFMIKLHDALVVMIDAQTRGTIFPPKVIYSSHLVPGEGEHKIMDYYRGKEITSGPASKQGASHIIYGLDADLIMLSLLSPLNNIFLYQNRSEINYKTKEKYIKKYVININTVKFYLKNENQNSKRKNKSTIIDDFVVMGFLLGNDFLPRFPIYNDIGEILIQFIDIYFENDFVLTKLDNEGNASINWEGFYKFIEILALSENDILEDLALSTINNEILYPYRIIESSIRKNKNDEYIFNSDLYRNNWYKNALGYSVNYELSDELGSILGRDLNEFDNDNKSDVKNMCVDYLRMIAWNYLYYKEGTSKINSDLGYFYHHTPMLKDLKNILKPLNINISGYKSKNGVVSFTALHQLVAVLPLHSKGLLPEELWPLFDKGSIINDIFPNSFTTELDGITKEKDLHKGVKILPFVDRKRIYEAVSQYKFTYSRAKIWLPQKDKKFEKVETESQKTKRNTSFLQYKTIKLEFGSKNPKSKASEDPIPGPNAFEEIEITQEQEEIFRNLEKLTSYGIGLGKNVSTSGFKSNHVVEPINNRINKFGGERPILNNVESSHVVEPINNRINKFVGERPILNNVDSIPKIFNAELINKRRHIDPITTSRGSEAINKSRNDEPTSSNHEAISRNDKAIRRNDKSINRGINSDAKSRNDEPISRNDKSINRGRNPEAINKIRNDEPKSINISTASGLLPVPKKKILPRI